MGLQAVGAITVEERQRGTPGSWWRRHSASCSFSHSPADPEASFGLNPTDTDRASARAPQIRIKGHLAGKQCTQGRTLRGEQVSQLCEMGQMHFNAHIADSPSAALLCLLSSSRGRLSIPAYGVHLARHAAEGPSHSEHKACSPANSTGYMQNYTAQGQSEWMVEADRPRDPRAISLGFDSWLVKELTKYSISFSPSSLSHWLAS